MKPKEIVKRINKKNDILKALKIIKVKIISLSDDYLQDEFMLLETFINESFEIQMNQAIAIESLSEMLEWYAKNEDGTPIHTKKEWKQMFQGGILK